MNKVETALTLKSFLQKKYHLQIGEIACLDIVKCVYSKLENDLYESLKFKIRKEVCEELINHLKEVTINE
ncbi:hypothetical protein GLV96_02625 [Staphylococcus agnetis]|uniref:hypothetical protein n=1 Tax=Staphylococcus agnetis TaxID=985762 RepID=UPI0014318BC1|nr:hypothetical protein [Staphylococcus agnetis]NJH85452.1 hypothetical protein [Staphylococcus agnetis]NJI15983.1 hypothetical protein [Staphylococcus agnetis]